MMNSSNKLSKRLSYFKNYYVDQNIIWDIGCDHGHLGLSFQNHPRHPEMCFVDPSAPVIAKLIERINASDIPRTKVFHQEGQMTKLDPSFSHFIFIAGMGGPEIIEILENLLPQMKDEDLLLISPHTKVLDVRAFLSRNGEWIHKEDVIFDSGIWYPHFLLGKNGAKGTRFGDSMFKNNEGPQYREHLLLKLQNHRDDESKEYLDFLRSI